MWKEVCSNIVPETNLTSSKADSEREARAMCKTLASETLQTPDIHSLPGELWGKDVDFR